MKFFASIAAGSIALSLAAPAHAWGAIGHRVSAQLAQSNISGHTAAQVELILGQEDLAQASTYADEQRSNPDVFWQKTAPPFHYVTLPPGISAKEIEHPPQGDALSALEDFTATLRNSDASQSEKALALRFIVHLVSDLHMPLHAGNGLDRGGNDFKVTWFDRPTNLHWVWDTGLIQGQELGAPEYAARLERAMSPSDVIGWWDADPAVWIDESAQLRDRIYPAIGHHEGMGSLADPVALGYDYNWQWTPAMERRLAQSGVRLAAYLDWVFAGEPGSEAGF